jgi:hydrogenase maturation protease
VRTLVLGIGNSILGDDGIGAHVAQKVAEKIRDESVDVKEVSFDGLNLLEHIVGYGKLIVIDAILTKSEDVGRIYRLRPENITKPSSLTTSPHHFNLAATLDFGRKLFPNEMPEEVIIFAVGTQDVKQVSEEMTREVKEAAPKVVALVLAELGLAPSLALFVLQNTPG